MNLFLIGYRCTGKTTIGKAIAAAIDWSFVDADTLLVRECGKPIKEIVDIEGWDAFRRMEHSTLKQICTADRQVVATGGGVVLDKANIKAMKTSGMVIWLGATAETIQTNKGRMQEIEDMLLKRNPYYKSARDFSIQTDDAPVSEITQTIIEKLNESNGDML
jgi:shikimate kinase